jgi:hypothetical protein
VIAARGVAQGLFQTAQFVFFRRVEMATTGVDSVNGSIGAARDKIFDSMATLLADDNKMKPGEKSALLLQAQAALGVTDGVQNIMSKAYNRWAQTGQ